MPLFLIWINNPCDAMRCVVLCCDAAIHYIHRGIRSSIESIASIHSLWFMFISYNIKFELSKLSACNSSFSTFSCFRFQCCSMFNSLMWCWWCWHVDNVTAELNGTIYCMCVRIVLSDDHHCIYQIEKTLFIHSYQLILL